MDGVLVTSLVSLLTQYSVLSSSVLMSQSFISKSSCLHVEYPEIIRVYQSFGFLGAVLGRDQISPLHHALKETESKAFTSSFLPFTFPPDQKWMHRMVSVSPLQLLP